MAASSLPVAVRPSQRCRAPIVSGPRAPSAASRGPSRPSAAFAVSTRIAAAATWAAEGRVARGPRVTAATIAGISAGFTVSTMSPPAAMKSTARAPGVTGRDLLGVAEVVADDHAA